MLLSEIDIQNGQVTKKDEGSTHITYQGLPITVENEEGSLRRWKNNEIPICGFLFQKRKRLVSVIME